MQSFFFHRKFAQFSFGTFSENRIPLYTDVYGEQKPTEGPYIGPGAIYGPRAQTLNLQTLPGPIYGPRAQTLNLQTLAFATAAPAAAAASIFCAEAHLRWAMMPENVPKMIQTLTKNDANMNQRYPNMSQE